MRNLVFIANEIRDKHIMTFVNLIGNKEGINRDLKP